MCVIVTLLIVIWKNCGESIIRASSGCWFNKTTVTDGLWAPSHFPYISSQFSLLPPCIWSVSLDNSFEMGCQQEHKRWHAVCTSILTRILQSAPVCFSPHLFFCCSLLTFSPCYPSPSFSLASTIFFSLRLLPPSPFSPCPLLPQQVSYISDDDLAHKSW